MTPANGNGSGNGTVAALQGLRADLVSRFPEREAVVDGALCALLAGEHVLLLGPPGTAKSALVRALAQSLQCRYFEQLLTKFSTRTSSAPSCSARTTPGAPCAGSRATNFSTRPISSPTGTSAGTRRCRTASPSANSTTGPMTATSSASAPTGSSRSPGG